MKPKAPSTAQLDKLWSEAVKLSASNKCEYCGRRETLNSHHIFTRTNRSVRWDTENGVCLCVGHHTFDPKFSAHRNGMAFAEWIRDYRGELWYKALKQKANIVKKWTKPELIQLKESLKQEIEKYAD